MTKAERRRRNRSLGSLKGNWALMSNDERETVHKLADTLVARSQDRHLQKRIDRAILRSIPENF